MRATLLLIVVNVAVYAAMLGDAASGQGGNLSTALQGFPADTLLKFGADRVRCVLALGEVWRLLTATLVHINLGHVAMNMIALFQVGRLLEARWGTPRILAAYVMTGLGGSLVSMAWYAAMGLPLTISAGASGAICGLIGAAAVVGHLLGGPQGLRIRNSMLQWGGTVVFIGFFIHADNAAHVGGFLAGAAFGLAIEKLGVRRRGSVAVELGAMALFLALAGAAFAISISDGGGACLAGSRAFL